MHYIKRSRHNPKTLFPILGHYVKKAFATHTQMFRTIANVVLPVAAVLAFVITVNYWSSVTFALKVSYDNKELGYISDESVYNEAQSAAKERMTTTKSDFSVELEEPSYELSLVSLNKLVDSSILCDRIIENSESNVTNACGIYIDDDFICSVKNETDASSVFNAILDRYQVTDSNSFVDFVEKVEYVQGLYPDDPKTMWDASKLKKQLEQTKVAKKTYTVKDGDTIYGIAVANGLTEKQFMALNPDIGEYIHTGDVLTVANEVNYVRVKVMKTETRTVEVDYDVEKTNNASMFKGTSRVTRKGVTGEDTVTELVTYIDGQRVSSQEISRVRTREPVTEKKLIGTRSTRVSGGYNIQVSGRGFVWPAPACTYVSSPYGWRTLRGYSDFHTGVDLTLPGGGSTGAVIVASLDRNGRERAPKQFGLRSLHRHQPRRRSQDKIRPLPRRLYLRQRRTACQRGTGDSASRQHRQRHRTASPFRDNHKRQHGQPASVYQIKYPCAKRTEHKSKSCPRNPEGRIFVFCEFKKAVNHCKTCGRIISALHDYVNLQY